MTYCLLQLAPGSYDVELDGRIIASLVSYRSRAAAPSCTLHRHRAPFDTLTEAQAWLGDPEVVHTPGGDFARRTILSGR